MSIAESGKNEIVGSLKGWAWLTSAEKALSAAENLLAWIGTAIVVFFMFLSIAEIVGRYAFKRPIYGYMELAQVFIVVIVFSGLAYTQRLGAQIRMDALISKLGGKQRHVMEAAFSLLALVPLVAITVWSGKAALWSMEIQETWEYLTYWPFKMVLPVGTGLLCVRLITGIARHLISTAAPVGR